MANLTKEQINDQLRKAGVKPKEEARKISIESIESFGDQESLLGMYKGIADYNKMLNERITLVNRSLSAAIPFTRENLYLFCAYSGSGKSTVAANISFPLWKQKKKVLVISNEEDAKDIIFRIACLDKGYNFNDWKKNLMPIDCIKEVAMLYDDITDYVKVVDVKWEKGGTQRIEMIKGVLETIRGNGYSCAIIDYFQLIQYSLDDPSHSRYDVLNDFRNWINIYIKSCEVPIVLFAQLHSTGKRGESLDSRIKECSNIIEPATVIIEVVPNFEDSTSSFCVWKDRFGIAQGTKIVCPFDKGRFLEQLSEREQAVRKLDKLVDPSGSPITIVKNTLSAGADYDAGQKV